MSEARQQSAKGAGKKGKAGGKGKGYPPHGPQYHPMGLYYPPNHYAQQLGHWPRR